MTPPEDPADAGTQSPAVLSCLRVLKRRQEFLAAARARKQGTAGMMVQMRNRRDGDPCVGVGFTCSRKVGNAVTRNRAKRRLRALAREILPAHGMPGHDYVLIGKPDATTVRAFHDLRDDLLFALGRLHRT